MQRNDVNTIKLVTATRIHCNDSNELTNINAVIAFLTCALTYSDEIIIAVGHDNISQANNFIEYLNKEARSAEISAKRSIYTVRVLHVSPWGKFVPALNALLTAASNCGATFILFQSLETLTAAETVEKLVAEFDLDTDLVVGAKLDGHEFSPGIHVLSGTTTPWNTLALWSVQKLSRIGFITASEGLLTGVAAGVEEVCAISLQQLLQSDCQAKLLKLNNVKWDTDWSDEARCSWHERKMSSKMARSESQIAALCLNPGKVIHIDYSIQNKLAL